MIELAISTQEREQFVDITDMVRQAVASLGLVEGTVVCFVPHTTAGLTINENADPDVRSDLLTKLRALIPQHDDYRHAEGNSDAHLKASLMGFSALIPVNDGYLVLGTWQGIYFCEFDGPRTRRLIIVPHA